MYNLVIDDERTLEQCYNASLGRVEIPNPNIYLELEWIIVRTYDEFINILNEKGIPNVISFDHDLGDFNDGVERTGKTCAKYLSDYCIDNKIKMPEFYVHSSNIIGTKNIISFLKNHVDFIDKERR